MDNHENWFHYYEFDKMLAFWQEALHYVPREPASGGWVVLQDPEGQGPNISLDQVPGKRTGKRSRLHLDLYTSNQPGCRSRTFGKAGGYALSLAVPGACGLCGAGRPGR